MSYSSSISIIGVGNFARVLAGRAVEGGNAVEVIGRDQAKAASLAKALGGDTAVGTLGATPTGDIVVLSVPHTSAATVVGQYGDALAGKILVDVSNPFSPGATALETTDGASIAEQVAAVAPASAHVVKAFNTVFGRVLAQGRALDVFIAGDDAAAKASVSAFVESLGLRPLDAGPLAMAHTIEHAALLMMGLASHGVGNYDFALGVVS
jgi:8-hydroxy-5-deazaflavin:NADPH oxidoreductase